MPHYRIVALLFLILPLTTLALSSPTISSVTRSSTGSVLYTVSGKGFVKGAKLTLGGVAPLASWQGGSTFIVFQPPKGKRGTVDVKVVNPDGGSVVKKGGFTYPTTVAAPVVKGVAPAAGSNVMKAVWGSNFESGATVYVNNVLALSQRQVGTQYIVFAPPSGVSGSVTVEVRNPSGGKGSVVAVVNGGAGGGTYGYQTPVGYTTPIAYTYPTPATYTTPYTDSFMKPPFPRLATYYLGVDTDNYWGASEKLSKLDFSIFSWWEGYRTREGKTLDEVVARIKSLNPKSMVFVYINNNEKNNTYSDSIFKKIDQMRWWAYDGGGNIVKSIWGDGNFNETNNTTLTQKDENGWDWVQWYAHWTYDNIYRGLGSTLDGFFLDNVFLRPRVGADWNRDGSTDSAGSAEVGAWFTQGIKEHFDTLHALMPGKFQIGNSGCEVGQTCPQLADLDGGILEGMIGYGWSPDTWGGWDAMMNSYHHNMTQFGEPKLVIFAQIAGEYYGKTAPPIDYQSVRYGLTATLMDDGYYGYSPNEGYGEPPWVDEYDAQLGYAKSGPVTSPYQNGVYRRDFDNGIALVNPKGNGQQTISLGGSFRKLSGSQAPNVNNGQNVTSVTLQDRDGIILLR